MAQTYRQRKKTKVELKVWFTPDVMEKLDQLCVATQQDRKVVLVSLIENAHKRMAGAAVPIAKNGPAAAAARVQAAGARREALVVSTGEVAADGRVRRG